MRTVPLQPLGVRVEDLDLADPALDLPGLVPVLRDLLAEHGVVHVPDQHALDDDGFLALLQAFGPLAFTTGETPLASHPQLNVISNVGRESPPVSNWHVDTSYVDRPPAYTALRAVQVPVEGGATQFSDQYAALDSLPDDLRALLADKTLRHVVTGVDPGPGEQTEAEHPLFRPHPVTGRPALYLTAPKRCAAISGLDEVETREVVARLLDHSTRPDNVLAHRWAPGDVVLWDNACVLHRADHSAVVGDRVMHRGMVASHVA
ncbi:TauD/TfdA family dioxygenase [Nocardioides sp.]|uniref:TauD/TfdA dioxygenase family protein n=1 Tax=Nocardioides sp. TaxID=35761 RepID=UPI0026302359|nr:TauD/TfdA family dioxygenase [Nocardioides sp.]